MTDVLLLVGTRPLRPPGSEDLTECSAVWVRVCT
jgi:hypothetical protein